MLLCVIADRVLLLDAADEIFLIVDVDGVVLSDKTLLLVNVD